MSANLTTRAGETSSPWIWTIATETGFPTVDLSASTITLRIGQNGVGLLDLTIGNGLTLSGQVVTGTMTAAQSAALGAGTFSFELRVAPSVSALYVPDAAAEGTLRIGRALMSAPA
jgi:hypothetical protein